MVSVGFFGTLGMAGQDQVVADCLEDDAVEAELVELYVGHKLGESFAAADQDLPLRGRRLALSDDLQVCPGHLFQV
jgi:hypothetical protein